MPDQEVPRFSAAEVNLVLHATEDGDKVLRQIQDVLSVPSERFSGSPVEGHHKNRIILVKATVTNQEASELALRIMSLLNSADRERLSRNLQDYSDEKGNLYIRLDKQTLCQGKVALAESDAIRIKFKPIRRYKPSGNLGAYRGLLSSTG